LLRKGCHSTFALPEKRSKMGSIIAFPEKSSLCWRGWRLGKKIAVGLLTGNFRFY
jgi:hypothetical protein